MDFQAVKSAVAKVMKDYQPLVNLAEGLDKVEKSVNELGDLEKAKAALVAELSKFRDEKAALEAEVTQVRQAVERAKKVYEDIKAQLDAFKG